MRPDYSTGVRLLAATTLAAWVLSGCSRTTGPKGTPTGEKPPEGSVVAGLIVRDAETAHDIETSAGAPLPSNADGPLRFEVTKSRYRLDVYRGDQLLKTYPVALGGSPQGPKQAQGDSRTPEGIYALIPHHESPGFGTCFYICYPNESDADRGVAESLIGDDRRAEIIEALGRGSIPPHDTPLGGLILLHGRRHALPGQTATNWTDGCIAMQNEHLRELLGAFRPDDRPTLLILP